MSIDMGSATVDMSVFAPPVGVERDPYNGMTREHYEARQAEKNARTQRVRELNKKAKDGNTPNRELWCCTMCAMPFASSEPIYLHYQPTTFLYSAKCGACREAFASEMKVPIKQDAAVVEVAQGESK